MNNSSFLCSPLTQWKAPVRKLCAPEIHTLRLVPGVFSGRCLPLRIQQKAELSEWLPETFLECAAWQMPCLCSVVSIRSLQAHRRGRRCDKGKPAVRRGRKAQGPHYVGEVARLPNSGGVKGRSAPRR